MNNISVFEQLDVIEKKVMSGLKDFQKATVNRLDKLYRSGQLRVLVSDEVGLGKTMIARGAIVKFAQMQKEAGKLPLKVAYICSNASIAEQNIKKFQAVNNTQNDISNSSRLSMLHLNVFMQQNDTELHNQYIQFIPLTPDTSFRMTRGTGMVAERALMYAILKRMPEFACYKKALETAMKDNAEKAWETWAKVRYEEFVINCDKISKGKYIAYMLKNVSKELNKKTNDGNTVFEKTKAMCGQIKRNGYQYQNNDNIIKMLRYVFAKISMKLLQPDFVIIDEFQRFKYLINSNAQTEMGMLISKFFSDNSRILLLSATPYKMYSTLEEIDDKQTDEHYSEFFDIMNFLKRTEEEQKQFKTVWENYSAKLKELTKGNVAILSLKNSAEEAMYQHVCRTERISAFECADLIDSNGVTSLNITEQDIKSYVQLQELLKNIGATFTVPVDYVKSAPYLMSFMRDYQLKRKIEKYFIDHPDKIRKVNKEFFWVKRATFNNYEKVPNNNARLDNVMLHTFKDNAELLLWVPPAHPYYELQGVFKNISDFSKTLIFSSWEMVPRMLAVLLSYEAERKTIGKSVQKNSEKKISYFYSGERRYPSARLNFSIKNGIPNAMTLFCLLYPSQFLLRCYNPIDCFNRGLKLKEIEKEIRSKIASKLDEYQTVTSGMPDKRWYYIAPLLFDEKEYVESWLENSIYFNDDENGSSNQSKAFFEHLNMLKELYLETEYGKKCNFGKQPRDLIDVLTDMAIASPAIVINRMYHVYYKHDSKLLGSYSSQLAKIFINRMNTAESTAVIELACGKKSDDAHWKNLLTYCKQGNLQAMFDEYAHLLTTCMNEDDTLIRNLHKVLVASINIRTTIYTVDTFDSFKARICGTAGKVMGLRSHFAAAFTKGDGKEKDKDRREAVRNAFNSPFRPFVLASTSIGQEGLDFHNYCRRIVHWNLPSNPIDLEQREGRINRFECLAIRQNISKRYGMIPFKNNIWTEMFNKASEIENGGNGSDLIPFWGLTDQDDMVKIERIVPMYPFSRDELAYERLIKILSLYRLTLGQARQEELLEYIFKNCDNLDDLKKYFINLSPYYRTHKK